MLWGVCQGIRHATLLYISRAASCCTPSLVPLRLPQIPQVRCMSAAAAGHVPADIPQTRSSSRERNMEKLTKAEHTPTTSANPRRARPRSHPNKPQAIKKTRDSTAEGMQMMWRKREAARHAPTMPETARQARSQPQPQFAGSADKSRAVRRAGRPTAEERPLSREHHHKKREKADHPLTKSANPLQAWPQPQPELVDSSDRLWNIRRVKGSTQSHLREAISSELLAHLEDSEKIRVLAGLLVNTAIPRRAQRILLIAHDLGIPLKLNAFEAVAYQLAETAQWDQMSSLVSLARRICGRTSTRLQNWRARALIEVSHFDLLDHVLHDFEEENIQPTRRTFHIILSGHLQNRNLAKAKECLSRMERAGHKMDASTHAIIARAYRSLGTDRAVVAGALKALPELTGTSATAVLNSLLQLALDADDLDTALGYLNFFDTHPAGDILGPTGDNITLPAGEDPVPVTSTIVPDVATFTIIINYLAKRRNFPLAMQMLERMKASGICPDSVLAAAVIRVHCAVGDIQSALRMTARMCENVPRARAIFQWLGMRGKGHDLILGNIPVTIDVLNALLRGVLAHVGVEGMRGMYDLMRAAGVKPNAETVAVFLAHLERVEQASPHYLLVLLNKFSRTIPPTLQHIHIIFRAVHARERSAMQRRGWWSLWAKLRGDKYLRESEPWWIMPGSQEHDATGKIREIQPFPVDHTYARLLEPILRSLESRNIQADRAIVHLRMRREVVIKRNVEEAEAFLQAMLDRGMRVTPYHISTIMQGYVLRDDVAQAERIFRSSGAAGIRPSVILYTILIAGYAQRGIPGQALRVFRDMINAGISPDVGSIDALASAWFAVGAFAMARQVLIQMWPHVAPFPEDFRMRSTHFLATTFRKLGSLPTTRSLHQTQQQHRKLLWKIKRVDINWRRFRSRLRYRLRREKRRLEPYALGPYQNIYYQRLATQADTPREIP